MSAGVNCLVSYNDVDKCDINYFDETRPLCSEIATESDCNASVGCYFAGGTCQDIGPSYCTTATTIEACRKDSNDYCYFSGGQCKACNTGSLSDASTNYKLISMDGRHCFPKSYTCKPYYQQGNHAACRKYCEFIYAPNGNWGCDLLENSSRTAYIYDHALISDNAVRQCTNNGGSISSFGQPYIFYLTQEISRGYGCMANNVYNYSGNLAAYKKSGKYVTNPNPTCGQNFVKIDYEPVAKGESGPLLTGRGIEAQTNQSRLLSYFCTCPPGYKLTVGNGKTADTCTPCDSGTISIDYDSETCISTALMPIDINGALIPEICNIWQTSVVKTINRTYFYVCQDCPPGQYDDGTKCTLAPKSWYVKVPTKDDIATRSTEQFGLLRCQNGTTESEGAYDEFLCMPLQASGQVIAVNGTLQNQCPDGQRLKEGTVMCELCPAGQFYDKNSQLCKNCAPGTYRGAMEADNSCNQCAKGMTSVEGATSVQACIKCQQGLFMKDGSCVSDCGAGFGPDTNSVCQPCQDGYQSSGTAACSPCTNGEAASLDHTSCVTTCSIGEGKQDAGNGALQCKKCAPGTFGDQNGNCQQCPEGQITSQSGQLQCMQCTNGQAASATQDSCVSTCTPGQGLESVVGNDVTSGARQCKECQKGTFSDGTSACAACSDGYTAESAGSTSCTACTGNLAASLDHTACTDNCTAGSGIFATSDSENRQCRLCPPGSAGDGQNCAQCQPGTVSMTEGSATCTSCGQDEASSSDGTRCTTTCAPGEEKTQVTGIQGQMDVFQCQPCSAGTFGDGTVSCEPCEAGTASGIGQSVCSVCSGGEASSIDKSECVQACGPGAGKEPVDEVSDKFQCVSCVPGTFSVEGTGSCVQCPAGSFTKAPQSSSCTPCQDGYAAVPGSDSCTPCSNNLAVSPDQASCVEDCGLGFGKIPTVSPDSTNNPIQTYKCVQCVPGTFGNGSGICALCQAGTFSEAGAGSCNTCPFGQVSSQGSGSCQDCQSQFSSQNKSVCVATCPPGQGPMKEGGVYLESGQSGPADCTPCLVGSFSAQETNFYCQICSIGSISAQDGQSCTPCTNKQFVKNNQCIDCPENTIQDAFGTGCIFDCGSKVLSIDGKSCLNQCESGQQKIKNQCEVCPENSVSEAGQLCTPCGEGFRVLNNKCINQSNYNNSNTNIGGIIAGVVLAILAVTAIVLGIVFGLKARRAKNNALAVRRNVYNDENDINSQNSSKVTQNDLKTGARQSQVLI